MVDVLLECWGCLYEILRILIKSVRKLKNIYINIINISWVKEYENGKFKWNGRLKLYEFV